MFRLIISIIILSVFSSGVFGQNLTRYSEPRFLPHEEAFQFMSEQNGETLTLTWSIAPGYYLYKDKITINDDPAGLVFSQNHESHYDEYFGSVDIFRLQAKATINLLNLDTSKPITITYQGCAEEGLCYQPVFQDIKIDTSLLPEPASKSFDLSPDSLFGSNSMMLVTLGFFVLGLALAFTPCVLPMLPILAGVVGANQGRGVKRSLALAISYSQGMAITFTGIGIVVALLGAQFSALFQSTFVLVFISMLFVLLALSMFGALTVQAPLWWQNAINTIKVKGGSISGAFFIGATSGLIASPCTTAPLSGALLYIAQSGDVLQGGTALYALAFGMTLPLIAVSVSGAKLLPKPGPWMNFVKGLFGIALLGLGVTFIERTLPLSYSAPLWYGFISLSALIIAWLSRQHLSTRVIGRTSITSALVAVTSLVLFAQSLMQVGHDSVLVKFESFSDHEKVAQLLKTSEQPVLVDFYADWCVACKDYERYTFSHPDVAEALEGYRLVKIDVTKMTEKDRELMQQFDVMGLPTLLHREEEGIKSITGFYYHDAFIEELQK